MTCKQWKFIRYGSKSYQNESNENQITIKRRWQRRQSDDKKVEGDWKMGDNCVKCSLCSYGKMLLERKSSIIKFNLIAWNCVCQQINLSAGFWICEIMRKKLIENMPSLTSKNIFVNN